METKTFKIRKTSRVARGAELQDQEEVANLKDLRLAEGGRGEETVSSGNRGEQLQAREYQNDEENLNCFRFPHSSFCGCDSSCLMESFQGVEVIAGLTYGPFGSGLQTKHLLEHGITHILNVTSREYTRRPKYFEYLTLDLHNNTEEDAKKFFRLTNRFIRNALSRSGHVFVHASDLQLAVVIVLGYLIGILRLPLKQALPLALRPSTEISPHFMKQLESYDLEKMAFVSLHRQ